MERIGGIMITIHEYFSLCSCWQAQERLREFLNFFSLENAMSGGTETETSTVAQILLTPVGVRTRA